MIRNTLQCAVMVIRNETLLVGEKMGLTWQDVCVKTVTNLLQMLWLIVKFRVLWTARYRNGENGRSVLVFVAMVRHFLERFFLGKLRI